MQLYSEYVVNEGLKEMWVALVNKAKQVLPVVSFQGIKDYLTKTKIGKFFFGCDINPESLTTNVDRGTENMKKNLAYFLKLAEENGTVLEGATSLNGFYEGDAEKSGIPQVSQEHLVELLNHLMRRISKSQFNPQKLPEYDIPIIYGSIGVGKTSILKQCIYGWNDCPDHKRRGLILTDGGQLTSDSFLLPSLIDVSDSQKNLAKVIDADIDIYKGTKSQTTRLGAAPAAFLPLYEPTGDPSEDAERDRVANCQAAVEGVSIDGGLIVIDEFFRSEPTVFKNLMNVLQQRRMGGGKYLLGSKWAFVLLSNRPCDDSEVSEAFDRASGAFLNRICPVLYIPKRKEWLEWAAGPGEVYPTVIQYIKEHPDKYAGVAKDKAFAYNPRTWTDVSTAIKEYSEDYDSKEDLLRAVNKFTILRSASDAVPEDEEEEAPLLLQTIASKISTEETKEFAQYWANALEKELHGEENTNLNDNVKVDNSIAGLIKPEVESPGKIFKVKNSDDAENLGSQALLKPLKVSESDIKDAAIKESGDFFLNKYVSLFGVYPGAPTGKYSFVTRTIEGRKDDNLGFKSGVPTYKPLKGTIQQAAIEDAKMLKAANFEGEQKCWAYATYLLLNNELIFKLLGSRQGSMLDPRVKDFQIEEGDKEAAEVIREICTDHVFDTKEQKGFAFIGNICNLMLLKAGGARKPASEFIDGTFSSIRTFKQKFQQYIVFNIQS